MYADEQLIRGVGRLKRPKGKAKSSVIQSKNASVRACLRLVHSLPKTHPLDSCATFGILVAATDLQELLLTPGVELVKCVQCQYGERFRMSTLFLFGGLCSSELTRNGRQQLCGHPRKLHLPMMGCAPTGLTWTTTASNYPRALFTVLAKMLMAQTRCTVSA